MRRVQINSAGTPPLAVIRRRRHHARAADRPCSNATTTNTSVRKFTRLNPPCERASGNNFHSTPDSKTSPARPPRRCTGSPRCGQQGKSRYEQKDRAELRTALGLAQKPEPLPPRPTNLTKEAHDVGRSRRTRSASWPGPPTWAWRRQPVLQKVASITRAKRADRPCRGVTHRP